MTEREARLDKKLSQAFAEGGIRRRELRLTAEEAAWAAARYPVRVVPMGPGGDKNWYEIIFQGAEP